ncbi:MAG: hypothetical protein LBF54_01535 [Holosporaceae bacterium]|nr:hypothetical protein [Holosporaceae bacterium]
MEATKLVLDSSIGTVELKGKNVSELISNNIYARMPSLHDHTGLTVLNEPKLQKSNLTKPNGVTEEDWSRHTDYTVKVVGKDITLREIGTIGDGSCGYRAIDPDRIRAHDKDFMSKNAKSRQALLQQLIDALESADKQEKIIELIAPEIAANLAHYNIRRQISNGISLYNKLTGNFIVALENLKKEAKLEGIEIKDNEGESFYEMIKRIGEICDTDTKKYPKTRDALEIAKKEDPNQEFSNSLIEACKTKEIAKSYLDYIKTNNHFMDVPTYGDNPTGVCDAIAYLNKFNLYIINKEAFSLSKSDKVSVQRGKVLHEYLPGTSAEGCTKIYLLINKDGYHFSRAVIEKKL